MIRRSPVIKSDTVWYIYALVDPRFINGVRYIGFSKDPTWRLSTHIEESRCPSNSYKCRWIRSLLLQGLKPSMRILEEGKGLNWQASERYWIKFYREEVGADLTNATDGGDLGHSNRKYKGRKLSKARRQKISDSLKRRRRVA